MDDGSYGIFVDGDNMNASLFHIVNDFILNRGTIVMKRVYGDFTQENMKAWKGVCIDYGVEPIMSWRIKSKNSSDIKMISDVMTILNTHPHILNFVLITGDSDISELCRKIISEKRYVIGVSTFDASTSKMLKNNCSEYIVLEHIQQLKPPIPKRTVDDNVEKDDIIRLLKDIIAFHSEDGGIDLGLLKKKLLRLNPTFHEKKYGDYKNFRKFIESCDIFYIKETEKGSYYVSTSE